MKILRFIGEVSKDEWFILNKRTLVLCKMSDLETEFYGTVWVRWTCIGPNYK